MRRGAGDMWNGLVGVGQRMGQGCSVDVGGEYLGELVRTRSQLRTGEVRRGNQAAGDKMVRSWIWISTGRNGPARHRIWPAATVGKLEKVERVGPGGGCYTMGRFGSASLHS